MSGTEWMVVVGGIAAIAWVNWYFFLAQRANEKTSSATATPDGGAPAAE